MSKENCYPWNKNKRAFPSSLMDGRRPTWEGIVLTRVLVVDDDVEMTDLLKIILEPNAFEVRAANCGSQGVEAVREFCPDVVILDLLMPDMDGWQVCKEIRKFSNVPILVLSALNKPGLAAYALDAGADDYLLKPMTSSVLIAHLKKLVRRARVEQEALHLKVGYGLSG
jgi:two-component system KDP operon response regulator KdpE